MKPETYKKYIEVFDYFSTPGKSLRHPNLLFMKLVATRCVSSNEKVTEVGGGTGFFTTYLFKFRPQIRLSFIEPSSEMIQIAQKRLPSTCQFYKQPLDEVLPTLEKQNVFIFQRVLYALYDNLESYYELFSKLYNKLEVGGYVCIQDFDQPIDIAQLKGNLIKEKSTSPEMFFQFENHWSLIEPILQEFNEKINNSTFTLFNSDMLDTILTETGFIKIFLKKSTCIYTKQI